MRRGSQEQQGCKKQRECANIFHAPTLCSQLVLTFSIYSPKTTLDNLLHPTTPGIRRWTSDTGPIDPSSLAICLAPCWRRGVSAAAGLSGTIILVPERRSAWTPCSQPSDSLRT